MASDLWSKVKWMAACKIIQKIKIKNKTKLVSKSGDDRNTSNFTRFDGRVVWMAVYMVSFLRCRIHSMKHLVDDAQHSADSMLNCSNHVWTTEMVKTKWMSRKVVLMRRVLFIPKWSVHAFLSNQCYGIDRRVPALQRLEIDSPVTRISFEGLRRPVNDTKKPIYHSEMLFTFRALIKHTFPSTLLATVATILPNQNLKNNLPADIVPDLIANVRQWVVVTWAHSQRTFQTANDRSILYPCSPHRLHFSPKRQHSLSSPSPGDRFPVRITYFWICVKRW